MFTVHIADLPIEIDNRYEYVEQICREYIPSVSVEKAGFRVWVSNAEVEYYLAHCGRPMTPPEAESFLLYRRICEKMPSFGAVLIHAAAVAMDQRGYLFCAPRGTGKSTHAHMWVSHFPGRALILNGDKPLIRRASDGRFWIYGTPWCGKEGLHQNAKVPLSAICFLQQNRVNRVIPADIADTTARLLESTILPPDEKNQDYMATLVGELIRKTPACILECRADAEAAEVACEYLSQI